MRRRRSPPASYLSLARQRFMSLEDVWLRCQPRNFIEIREGDWLPAWFSMEAGGGMAEVALLPLARIPRQVSRGGAPPRPKPFPQRRFTQPPCCVTKAGPFMS